MSDTNFAERAGNVLDPELTGAPTNTRPMDESFGAGRPMGAESPSGAPRMSFLDFSNKFGRMVSLSPEGIAYVQRIKTLLEEHSKSIPTPIVVHTLKYPNDTLVAVQGDACCIILFAEALADDDDNPPVKYIRSALDAVENSIGANIEMINYQVVTPDSYNRADIMASEIVDKFQIHVSDYATNVNIGALREFNFDISNNVETYKKYISRNDPHSVPLRFDNCYVLTMHTQNRSYQNSDLFDKASVHSKEIAAIGAYTEFVRAGVDNQGRARFVPIVHLSNLSSIVPIPGVRDILIALGYELLINQKLWMEPFKLLGNSTKSNQRPNIGNLIADAKGPYQVESLEDFQVFVNRYCAPAILAIDIIEGRSNIPGMELYSFPSRAHEIIEQYNTFVPDLRMNPSQPVGITAYTKYTGTVGNAKDMIDSAYVDYLNVMIHHKDRAARAADLLDTVDNPNIQVQIVREFRPELRLQNVTHTVLLDVDTVNTMSHAILSNMNINLNTGNNGVNVINPNGYLTISESYGRHSNSFATGFGARSNEFSRVWDRNNNSFI